MKLFLLAFSSVFQLQDTDTLSLIYDRIENGLETNGSSLTLQTDKDLYFPGEKVFFSVKCTTCQSNLFYVLLLDSNKELLDYTRSILDNNNIGRGSLLISDTINVSSVWVSAFNPMDTESFTRKITLINPEATKPEKKALNLKAHIHGKSLIPEVANDIYIINSGHSAGECSIVDEADNELSRFFIRYDKSISFIPSDSHHYFLKYENSLVPLPKVEDQLRFEKVELKDDKLSISMKKNEHFHSSYLIVTSGNEILWLSELDKVDQSLQLDIGTSSGCYLWAFLVNDQFELIDKQIIDRPSVPHQIIATSKEDSLQIAIPSHLKNVPFNVRLVEKNFLTDFIVFSQKELDEIRRYGEVPTNLQFATEKAKVNWVNYALDLRLASFLKQNDSKDHEVQCPRIVYEIPNDIKIDEHLKVHAIDLSGSIINFKIIDHLILINPCEEFKYPESTLMLTVTYKNRQIAIKKLENIEENFLKKRVAELDFSTSEIFNRIDEDKYLSKIKSINETIFLDEVTISSSKPSFSYPWRGQTLALDQIKIDDYTITAHALLPQIGVNSHPDINTGFIMSSRRFFRYNQYHFFYPLSLTIIENERVFYSGMDFRKLKDIPAKSVISMTKVSRQPESVFFKIKPGWRGFESTVYFEKISEPGYINDNIGVAYSYYKPDGDLKNINIPMPISVPAKWEIRFFLGNETFEYQGEVTSTNSD